MKVSAELAMGFLVFGALALSGRSTPLAPTPTTTGEIARIRTAPTTRSEWIRTRLDAARTALAGRVPEASRESIARDFVAHWIREVGPRDTTASGATAEYNYNIGNVTAGRYYRGAYYIGAGGRRFRAYATLASAVTDYLNIVSGSSLYRASWAQLLSAPDDVAEWNAQLVAAGYEDPSTANIAEVRTELPQNRATVDAWVTANA